MSGNPYIKENERLEAEIARLRGRLDNYVNTIGRENIQLEEANEKLRAALEEIIRRCRENHEAGYAVAIACKALVETEN